MKRSTFLGMAGAGFVAAQSAVTSNTLIVGSGAKLSRRDPATRKREYEICKVRGHVPTIEGNGHFETVNTIYVSVPDKAARAYEDHIEGPWRECFHCGTRYRFVTNIEEQRP